jgi:hypothetical protein
VIFALPKLTLLKLAKPELTLPKLAYPKITGAITLAYPKLA